jgi:hypothetical protein
MIRKIKTVQVIYIIEKVGLINQAPTRILIIKVNLISHIPIEQIMLITKRWA